eukprot:CAMPEP_0168725668 /NCGR_PEP_ID=MMETSP0724-20121128/4274_1 /TAXON_ID=265536 /ORGANISM="Amphiprora sp., Strain CCMP467" /LENGTH=741 /DNA_ID=CAMNT_0008772463 /DNA_START=10 /DNA_END=2236 /DNA_ORIENTATION=+
MKDKQPLLIVLLLTLFYAEGASARPPLDLLSVQTRIGRSRIPSRDSLRKLDQKCIHPETGETIHLDDECGKKGASSKGTGKGKGPKSTKTCSSAPYPVGEPTIRQLPTTTTDYYSPHFISKSDGSDKKDKKTKSKDKDSSPASPTFPTSPAAGKASSKGKGKGEGYSSPSSPSVGKAGSKGKSKGKRDGYSPSSPSVGKAGSKGKGKGDGYSGGPSSPTVGKSKKGKGDGYSPSSPAAGNEHDDGDIPICTPTQLGTSPPSSPSYLSPLSPSFPISTPSAPNSSPYTPSAPAPFAPAPFAPAPFTPAASPSTTEEDNISSAENCALIALGTSSPGTNTIEFNQELVMFSQGTPDAEKFQTLLQRFVAPRSVGCTISESHVLAAFSEDRRLNGGNVKSIVVGDFDTYDVDIGSNCGEPAPSESDNCISGKFPIKAVAKDAASLEGLNDAFEQSLAETLTDDVIAALGLTGVGGVKDKETDEDNGDGGGSSVSAVQSSDPGKAQLKVGPLIVIIFAGVGLLAILILGVVRSNSFAERLKHRRLEDLGYDDDASLLDDKSENRSYFDDEISVKDTASTASYHEETAFHAEETSAPPPRVIGRLAHVVGETDSTYTGSTWRSSRDRQVLELDKNGASPASMLHPPDETCSSPKCQHCEEKRQKSQVKFVKVAFQPKANRRLAERNYTVDDTVVLNDTAINEFWSRQTQDPLETRMIWEKPLELGHATPSIKLPAPLDAYLIRATP